MATQSKSSPSRLSQSARAAASTVTVKKSYSKPINQPVVTTIDKGVPETSVAREDSREARVARLAVGENESITEFMDLSDPRLNSYDTLQEAIGCRMVQINGSIGKAARRVKQRTGHDYTININSFLAQGPYRIAITATIIRVS